MSFIDDVVDRVLDRTPWMKRGAPSNADILPGLTAKGFMFPGGGAHQLVEAPPEFEATSTQVCGLWPFVAGASSPLLGAPLGTNLINGSVVCGDPMTYFVEGLYSAPSGFVLGLNARGKSSLVVRISLGCMDLGYRILALGDLKPDFVGMITEVDGQVISLGRGGIGGINPLDAGPITKYLHLLSAKARAEAEGQIHGRRVNALGGLIELLLKRLLDEEKSENTILSVAIMIAAEEAHLQGRQPLPADVERIITSRHERIRANILQMSDEAYDEEIKGLVRGLKALGPHGIFGGIFWNQTTVEMDIDSNVVFDVSSIDEGDVLLRAAVQLVTWSYGQAGALAAQTLAKETDADGNPLGREVHHLMLMDELWQTLQAWEGSVYRINTITKVNRQKGLGQIMITHSMKDLELSTPERTAIALGFMERSSMLFLGGLAENEKNLLRKVRTFSDKELALLVEWSAEGSQNPSTGEKNPPPGRGRFLLKTGEQPGTPFRTTLTPAEKRIHDTNSAWAHAIAAANGTSNGTVMVRP